MYYTNIEIRNAGDDVIWHWLHGKQTLQLCWRLLAPRNITLTWAAHGPPQAWARGGTCPPPPLEML